MWVEVALCNDKLYLACCYTSHRESNYYNLHELDHDDPFSDVYADILIYKKIGKVIVVGD